MWGLPNALRHPISNWMKKKRTIFGLPRQFLVFYISVPSVYPIVLFSAVCSLVNFSSPQFPDFFRCCNFRGAGILSVSPHTSLFYLTAQKLAHLDTHSSLVHSNVTHSDEKNLNDFFMYLISIYSGVTIMEH
jgi:hypothetical protein